MFHLISQNREELYETREGVFHLIFKHQEVIYQTREGVFHLIFEQLEVSSPVLVIRGVLCFLFMNYL